MSEAAKPRAGLVGEYVMRTECDAIGQIVAVHYDQADGFQLLVRIEERLEPVAYRDFEYQRPFPSVDRHSPYVWRFVTPMTEDELVAQSAKLADGFKAAFKELHELEANLAQLRAATNWLRQILPMRKKDQTT